MAHFQIQALPAATFQDLFELDDQELAARQAHRQIVQAVPGSPCRISLVDAEIGEEVILANYEHLPQSSPYRSSHAIFVRKGVKEVRPAANEIPKLFLHRLMGVRAYDKNHNMVNCNIGEGSKLNRVLSELFDQPEIEYIHLHNAKPGCFAAKAVRA